MTNIIHLSIVSLTQHDIVFDTQICRYRFIYYLHVVKHLSKYWSYCDSNHSIIKRCIQPFAFCPWKKIPELDLGSFMQHYMTKPSLGSNDIYLSSAFVCKCIVKFYASLNFNTRILNSKYLASQFQAPKTVCMCKFCSYANLGFRNMWEIARQKNSSM